MSKQNSEVSEETALKYQSINDDMIILNARGIKYEVPIDSFKRLPRSRLGKIRKYLLNDNFDEIKLLCDRFNEINNIKEIFFNRDPFVLNMILNFYQNGKLHMNHSECVAFIKEEIDYWNINDHVFETCCQLNFNEKLEETENLIETKNDLFEKLNRQYDFGSCLPTLREKLWNLFDNPNSSIYAKILFGFSTFTVLILIFDIIMRSIPELALDQAMNEVNKSLWIKTFDIIEILCFSWFIIEIFVRFISCPSKLKFLTLLNIIDILSILPFFIWLIFSKSDIPNTLKQILSTLRILLLFKISRHSTSLKSFGLTFKRSFKELSILVIYFTISVIFFSSIIYYCEKDQKQTKFTSIPAALWYGVITMTTVGYGDVAPQTVLGKIFGGLCAFCGVLIVSVPIGIISSNFSQVIKQQKKEKYFLNVGTKMMKIKKNTAIFNSRFFNELNLNKRNRKQYDNEYEA